VFERLLRQVWADAHGKTPRVKHTVGLMTSEKRASLGRVEKAFGAREQGFSFCLLERKKNMREFSDF
jgi:hypothetical protein